MGARLPGNEVHINCTLPLAPPTGRALRGTLRTKGAWPFGSLREMNLSGNYMEKEEGMQGQIGREVKPGGSYPLGGSLLHHLLGGK
jgi:hypothetical protein